MTYGGAPSASQIITVLDSLGNPLALLYSILGLGIAGESGTSSVSVAAMKAAIVGDGTSGNPGIGNSYQQEVSGKCDTLLSNLRWDSIFSRAGRDFIYPLDTDIQKNVPYGWVFTNSSSIRYLNNHLLRMNSAHPGIPVQGTPAKGTLTAANSANGAIPVCSIGNGPRVFHTYCGANEWDESLPSAQADQVAIASPNNSYTYVPGSGNIPNGTTLIKVYRGFVAGGASIRYLDQRVPVIGNQPYSNFPITITQPDSLLNVDWIPPQWLSCPIKPEAACIIALAYSTNGVASGFLSINPGAVLPGVPLTLTSAQMVSPYNVFLNPSNAFLGLGNNYVTQGAIFGTTVIGTGFTQGSVFSSPANNAAGGIQGFAGATNLRCRITSVCNVAPTVSLSYHYYDATNGYGVGQAGTIGGTFGAASVGTILNLAVPAGRLVYEVYNDSPSVAASGTYITEAQSVR